MVEAAAAQAPGSAASKRRHTQDTSYKKAPKIVPGGAVICISRLPHGFFESELRAYLSQFGDITRLRLSRNPRTSASRHYAFVEFRHADVARIVAETMNNYLLMGHLLQCKLLAEDQVHAELWKGANRKFVHIPWRKMEMKRYNVRMEKPDLGAEARLRKKKLDLEAKKIEYDCDSVIRKLEL